MDTENTSVIRHMFDRQSSFEIRVAPLSDSVIGMRACYTRNTGRGRGVNETGHARSKRRNRGLEEGSFYLSVPRVCLPTRACKWRG